jgi:vacuolar protein sorting-associated protein 53
MVKSKMNAELADNVSFGTEVDAYMDVLAYALNALQSGVMDRLEPAFRIMQNVNWASVTAVGEESSHIYQWQSCLHEIFPAIRDALGDTYFRTFCTKLASSFLQRYQDAIMRQKRVSETGTQQLLLDTYNVKTLLLHLHHLGLPSDSDARGAIPSMYMKLITSRIAHIEVILKLIGTPEEMLLERFKIMWSDGTAADFQTIMSLAGVSRVHQQQYLESLGLSHATAAAAGGSPDPSKAGSVSGGGSSGDSAASRLSGLGSSVSSRIPLPPIPMPPISGSAAAANANATVSSMASSMRSLTQDLSSSARSAVGDLRKGFLR